MTKNTRDIHIVNSLIALVLLCPAFIGCFVAIGSAQYATCTTSCLGNNSLPIASAKIQQPFDPPQQDWLPGHRGVDFAAKQGQVVMSPLNGIVVFSGKVGGKPVLSLQSEYNNLHLTFEPISGSVVVGDIVNKGDKIGTIDFLADSSNSHCSVQKCLHFGVKEQDKYIDPMSILKCCPIVLKK